MIPTITSLKNFSFMGNSFRFDSWVELRFYPIGITLQFLLHRCYLRK